MSGGAGSGPAPAREPVKFVLECRALPGEEERLTSWIRRLVERAHAAPGFEGASVLAVGAAGDHVVLLRFGAQEALDAWRGSDDIRGLLSEGGAHSIAGPPAPAVSGLETWFHLPGLAAPLPPPRWKMALVTWLALLPQVLLLGLVVPESLPRLAAVAISTAVPVVVLTWVAMPLLARALRGWLHPRPVAPARPGVSGPCA
jgi:antibiotic biosynthesis monooxygenase (ABM) superfamily enzyme